MSDTPLNYVFNDFGKDTENIDAKQGDFDICAAICAEMENAGKDLPDKTAYETINNMLEELLRNIEPIDFDAIIPHAENKKPLEKEKYVAIIDEVLRVANEKQWGICRNAEFIYIFNGEYWQIVDREILKHFLSRAAILTGLPKYHARRSDTADLLLSQFQFSGFKPHPENGKVLVNLRNGTLEISENGYNLRGFDSADFLKHQLPFDYDKDATAPLFQKFLDEVLPDKSEQDVLAEFFGYVFIKDLKLEKALILYGNGANGKSVVFDVITAMFSKDNISSCDISSLCNENGYHRAVLQNKLLNYGSEIGTGKQFKCDTFKRLCSGEAIQARLPYGQPFEISNYARMVFNANVLPKDIEQTTAYFRRFLIIPFNVTIPPERQDKELASKIISTELAGVLNWVLDGLNRVLKNRNFSRCAASDKALEAYRIESNSVLSFINDNDYVPSDGKVQTTLQAMYSEYKQYCSENNYHPCGNKEFKKRLRADGYCVDKSRQCGNANVVFAKKTDW